MTGERPRLGFVGAGWIGRSRMKGIAQSGIADIVAVADPVREAAGAAAEAVGAQAVASMDDLLNLDLQGLVIATPSALHASQSVAALDRGLAVFCQKPLGRNAEEVDSVVTAARRADRLLGIDLSYRFTRGLQEIHALIAAGVLGKVYAADLMFHNAYGPDKAWFYDRALSGGGCVVDLGVHLVDLAMWMVGEPVIGVSSRLFTEGTPWNQGSPRVEDFAVVRLDFAGGATASLSCSWKLPAGQDAVIQAAFYGTQAAARWRNVNGSFYDFVAERLDGTRTTIISEPPDEWGPRALIDWGRRLRESPAFDPDIQRVVAVSEVLDRIYAGEVTCRSDTPQSLPRAAAPADPCA